MSFRILLVTLSVACGLSEQEPREDRDTEEPCPDVTPVATLFATSCAASGGCHVPGGEFPDLTYSGLASLSGLQSRGMPDEVLVVPGDPDASWLVRKMQGEQGPDGGILMPVGSSGPIEGVDAVVDWVRAGAPAQCDEPPDLPTIPNDPNRIEQDALFTCVTPATGSPGRLRRIGRAEWTHAIGHSLVSDAYANPLHGREGVYSTYTDGVGMDAATLDLYLLGLPSAGTAWREQFSSPRLRAVVEDRDLRCMFDDAAPDAACIDHYVDRVLTAGVLFRTPTAGERARFRAFLVQALGEEVDPGQRAATLTHAVSGAWLASGALFRNELGEPVPGEARRRLTNDELALALGAVLSTHPTGSSLPSFADDWPGPPDRASPDLGWLGQIRAAAADGSIQDPDTVRQLLRAYRGGIDVDRADLALGGDERDVPSRGEYWLAPKLAGFFREWLDYADATTVFKDTPAETSAFEDERDATLGYANLQHSYYGYESTLVHQLDDTIARTVMEAEANGEDVFRSLLTTRQWRIPSNVATFGRGMHRVYGIQEDVPDTQEGRWITLPATERGGVLTHPAWLSAHGGNFEDDASAVLRGHWIREHLYCETVPGLELVMVEAQLVPSEPDLRARDRLRMSTQEGPDAKTCQGCHQLMDSLGLPFELYNHAGFLRVDDHGQPPEGSSTIDVAPDPSLTGSVDDPMELGEMLADSPYARRCFVRHVFRYTMGRDETLADACTLVQMEDAFASGSYFAMVEALVTSDTFRYRLDATEVAP